MCNSCVAQSKARLHPHALHLLNILHRTRAAYDGPTAGPQRKRISFKKLFAPLHRIHLMFLTGSRYYIYPTLTFWVHGEKREKVEEVIDLSTALCSCLIGSGGNHFWHTEHHVNLQLSLGLCGGPVCVAWMPGHPPRLIKATAEQSYHFPNPKCRQLLLAFPCMFYFK